MASNDGARALKGKVALVTGAGRGLGRAFAEKLAAMGADVAIHGMRENGPAEYGEGSTLTAVNCIAPGDTRTGRFMGTRAVDQNRMVETGTLDRIATVDEVRWGRSCQDKCCASTAPDSAGRPDTRSLNWSNSPEL
jgi:NAD(P)-dependent dehydrogenase (short-subunit alcohol dehydrogenase family)